MNTTLAYAGFSLSWAKKGPIIWQGPHQVAEKSTITCTTDAGAQGRRAARARTGSGGAFGGTGSIAHRLAVVGGAGDDRLPVRIVGDLDDPAAASHLGCCCC
jgi:hypothetical protein